MSVDVFNYSNYREFLRDYYEDNKRRKTGFTYARFSVAAGLKSPNYYKLVMDGQKSLTQTNIVRFANGMKLSRVSADYFEALVNFNQASSPLEKEYYQDRMGRLKERGHREGDQKTLEEYEFESLSHWLHHTIMVMTHLPGFREDPKWIKHHLFELASEHEISKALGTLTRTKLIKRDERGRLVQTHKRVKTRPDLARLAAQKFYEGLFQRIAQDMKLNPPGDRELGAIIVGLHPTQLPEIRRRARHFIRELNELALEAEKPERVYVLSFGAVPLTSSGDAS